MNCDFCGTWHSSTSCFHPGRQKYDDALAEIKQLRELVFHLMDDDDCEIDGEMCLTHEYFVGVGPCLHAVAKAILPADFGDTRPMDGSWKLAVIEAAEAREGK